MGCLTPIFFNPNGEGRFDMVNYTYIFLVVTRLIFTLPEYSLKAAAKTALGTGRSFIPVGISGPGGEWPYGTDLNFSQQKY